MAITHGPASDEEVLGADRPKPPPGNPRFPLVDGLRAVAALSVVLCHINQLTSTHIPAAIDKPLVNLNVSVVIFFAISGFLLYRPYVSARLGQTAAITTRGYYVRRALRIAPGYWLALTVLIIFPGLPLIDGHSFWRYYGFLQIYDAKSFIGGLSPAWTLCIEVTFYALLPLFALLMRRWARRELLILTTMALVSLAFRAWIYGAHGPSWVDAHGYLANTLLGTFHWFAIGMVIAVLSVTGRVPRVGGAMCIAITGAAFMALSFLPQEIITTQVTALIATHAGVQVLSCVVGAAMLLFAINVVDARLALQILGNRVMIWLGLVSYGIYLWHYSILQEIAAQGGTGMAQLLVAGAVLTAGFAAASYYLVELPAMRLGRRRRRSARAPA